jgi:hypothetical protein
VTSHFDFTSCENVQSGLILSLLSLFWKKNETRLMRSQFCLCIYVSPLTNVWTPEPIFMKLSIYIMAPNPISMAYFINSSHQSVRLYVYPPIVARQRLGKNVTAATNTYGTIKKLLDESFSMMSVSCQSKLGYHLRRTSCSLFYRESLVDKSPY